MTMFGSFLGRQKQHASPEIVSGRTLEEVIRSCPRCGLALIDHEYRLAAANPLSADEMDRFRELLAAIRSQEWQKVLTFQRWIGSQPNAEVYTIRCPDQQLSLAMISAPFELDEPYALMHKELIEESATFSLCLPNTDSWHRF